MVTADLKQRLLQAFLTALLLFGAMPLSYGSVPPSLGGAGSAVARGVGHANYGGNGKWDGGGQQHQALDFDNKQVNPSIKFDKLEGTKK